MRVGWRCSKWETLWVYYITLGMGHDRSPRISVDFNMIFDCAIYYLERYYKRYYRLLCMVYIHMYVFGGLEKCCAFMVLYIDT